MVFGDPCRFTVLVEFISCWVTSYKNGLFNIVKNGNSYPGDIRTSTLAVDISAIIDSDSPLVIFNELIVLCHYQSAHSDTPSLKPNQNSLKPARAAVKNHCIAKVKM